jgi:hypothetical protein
MSLKSRAKKERKKKDKQKERKNPKACDPLITKRKQLSFGRFTKQNKKDLQLKSPLEGKMYIYHRLFIICGEKIA